MPFSAAGSRETEELCLPLRFLEKPPAAAAAAARHWKNFLAKQLLALLCYLLRVQMTLTLHGEEEEAPTGKMSVYLSDPQQRARRPQDNTAQSRFCYLIPSPMQKPMTNSGQRRPWQTNCPSRGGMDRGG